MKLQVSVTSAFVPAALAVASISLSLLLLPGGGAPVRSSGVAPALKLAARDVVAAARIPVRAMTRAHSKPAVSRATDLAGTPATAQSSLASSSARSAPAARSVHHRRVSQTSASTPAPVTALAAPVWTVPLATEGHGNGKAFGHVRKIASLRAKTHGRPAGVPPEPPSVPLGQAKAGQDAGESGALKGRGGGK